MLRRSLRARVLFVFAAGVVFSLSALGTAAQSATSPLWLGRWQSNLNVTVSAGTLSGFITYVAQKGYTKENGSCKTTGMKAICNWAERYEAPTYTVEISGHSVLLLLGNTLMEHKVFDMARCDTPGVAPCEAAVPKIKGLVKTIKWKRM